MPLQFTVLASGSAGNASLLQADGFGLLVDAGLGPRKLGSRLTAIGASWPRVQAVLLTHTHGDHWNDRTLAYLQRLRLPFYCHPEHDQALRAQSRAFAGLRSAGLVRPYPVDEPFALANGLRCCAFRVRHDGGLTCGFRFDAAPGLLGEPYALGYAADLGCWEAAHVRALADVDVLALEFNHDVELERGSGRSPHLIARVLGDDGHLSNAQAAALVREVVRCSEPGRLRHLIQLHLSRDCNRPHLAAKAAQEVLTDLHLSTRIHTAHQDRPLPRVAVGVPANGVSRSRPRALRRPAGNTPVSGALQPWFSGWESQEG
jgi:phosphoribosyl 1,2-cyclic phosphodiesterase